MYFLYFPSTIQWIGETQLPIDFQSYSSIFRVDLSGKNIKDMLEKAIEGLYPNGTGYAGGLVQMSGIKVEYLISNYPGPKLQRVQTLCTNKYTGCEEEDWCEMKDDTIYKVALPRYVIGT